MSSITTNCECCGSEELANFPIPSSSGEQVFSIVDPTSIYLCHSCGFVANNKSSFEDYAKYYSEFNRHTTRSSQLINQDRHYYTENINVLKKISDSSSYRVTSHLDVGPGDDLFGTVLSETFATKTASYDIGDDLPEGKYDLITLFHTLEHWHNPKEQLKSFRDCLDEEGLIYISVPDISRYYSTYYGCYAAIDSEHINHFSAYSLQALLNGIGLKVIFWQHSDRKVSEDIYYPEIKILCTHFSSHTFKEDYVSPILRFDAKHLWRYLHRSDQDFKALSSMVEQITSTSHASGSTTVLYGLGIHARRIAKMHPNVLLADTSLFYKDQTLDGKTILGPWEVKELAADQQVSIIVCAVNSSRIVDYLISHLCIEPLSIHQLHAGKQSFPADQSFRSWRDSIIIRNSTNDALREISIGWQDSVRKHHYQYLPEWFGRPIIQDPQDILAVQELIFRVKPTVIIETGVARGGSISLSSTLLAALSYSDSVHNSLDAPRRRVVGIDIDIRTENRQGLEMHPFSNLITLIESSSVDPNVIHRLKSFVTPEDVVLVILDSDHTFDHVYQELVLYSQFVSKGSYIIVQDTGLEDADQNSFSISRPWGKGNGPKSAVNQFLRTTNGSNFYKDHYLPDKYLITSARDGFLERIS